MSKDVKWFKTGALRSPPSGGVDAGKGVIEGVSVCTMGEAKGHGVQLDSAFIDTVIDLGNGTERSGLKARFGHPNMCDSALGTFLGRFKNFRRVGDIAKADLFLSESSKETPNGDLHNYVLKMAADEPDMFGTSIVFEIGNYFSFDENGQKCAADYDDETPVYVTCESLHACDVVDEPAANDGLFSAFSGETMAGRITEFLDDNPGVFQALSSNPDLAGILSSHADEIGPFLTKYAAQFAEQTITENTPMKTEEVEIATVPDEAVETTATESPAEVVETEEVEAPAESDGESAELGEDETATSIDRAEFSRAVSEFGPGITAQAFTDGGGYAEAQTAYYSEMKAENERLKSKGDTKGATPGEFSAEPKPKAGLASLFAK
jgi:hypothetical protein